MRNIKRFNYRLTGTGWAEATFVNENQSIAFEVSYLSDPLSDLFTALYRLSTLETTMEKVVFADEPGEHILLLTKSGDANLMVEIFWSEEWEEIAIIPTNVVNKKLVYADSDTISNFIKTICLGINNLLQIISIEEYKKEWHLFEFPEESYSKLKHLINYEV